jgi:hypothetical protein
LAVASGLLVLLTFVIKEIIKEELKELHDSLANAESQFRLENGQSTIQFQLLAAQEELENSKLLADKERGKKTEDYSPLIAKDTANARQALAHMNADFESVSRLIDAFPSRVKDLRDLRDKSKDAIEKTNKNVEDFLKPRPEHDVGRFVVVRVAMVMAIMQEIPIAVLADTTLTAAHRLEGASEPPSVAQGGRGVVVAGCAARAGRESTRSANFWII